MTTAHVERERRVLASKNLYISGTLLSKAQSRSPNPLITGNLQVFNMLTMGDLLRVIGCGRLLLA